jgi:pilus assembly protein CpaB
MNKSSRIIFLVVALAAAALVSYFVYQKTALQTTVLPPQEKQNVVQVAVAATILNKGAKITSEDIRMVPFLKDSLPKGHFTEAKEAVGRIVLQSIQPTEPVFESALAPIDFTRGGIAAIIPPQKRAMAVKVDDVIGVAGFLQPGHLVDVLVSISSPEEQTGQLTKTVLENIPVLSIGTQAEESKEKGAKRVTVVTLEVDLEEAEKLTLAVNEGRIQLALRGYTDTDQILTKGTDVTTLLKSYATISNEPVIVTEELDAPLPRPLVTKPEFVVEVMNGNQINKYTMKAN